MLTWWRITSLKLFLKNIKYIPKNCNYFQMALHNLLTNFNANDTSLDPRRIAKIRDLFLAKKANSFSFKNNGVNWEKCCSRSILARPYDLTRWNKNNTVYENYHGSIFHSMKCKNIKITIIIIIYYAIKSISKPLIAVMTNCLSPQNGALQFYPFQKSL